MDKEIDQLIVSEIPEMEAVSAEMNGDMNIEKTREEILQEELEKYQEEASKNYEQYLRALAEVDNIKKRTQRDREDYIKYGNVSLIKRILPVLDDLERAIEMSPKTNETEPLLKGVEMTAKSLFDILKNEGVEVIESQGKPFDPQYHQPLTVEPSEAFPENTVLEELQRGYILHDRVIRPALVKVSGQ